ncbi:hypothetical protein AAHC03_025467 [Spirometra sp. Aus1]
MIPENSRIRGSLRLGSRPDFPSNEYPPAVHIDLTRSTSCKNESGYINDPFPDKLQDFRFENLRASRLSCAPSNRCSQEGLCDFPRGHLVLKTNFNNNNDDIHRKNSADGEEGEGSPQLKWTSFSKQQSLCWWESKEDGRTDLSRTDTPIGLLWLRANRDALNAREKRITEAIEKARAESEQIRKEKYDKVRQQSAKLREKIQKRSTQKNRRHDEAPHAKYAGTQTKNIQRSPVLSHTMEEQRRPSNNVDLNETSLISSTLAERECRLTRRGVESLKKACLVLEKELACICRSPESGSGQDEKNQVIQVQAEISHLQRKLLELSKAQKKRVAVLDRAVRLINQMSRIGSQSNMSHKSRCSSWTPTMEDCSKGSGCSSPEPQVHSPQLMKSKLSCTRSDFDEISAFMNDHHQRLEMAEPELCNHQRETGLPKAPCLRRTAQKGETDGRLASFRCLDIPKSRSSFPPGKSTVKALTSHIHNQAVKKPMDRCVVPRSLPSTQLKQGEKMHAKSSTHGQGRYFVNYSINAMDARKDGDQNITIINTSANPLELIKQRIESLRHRRECLRKILQEVTDRKHHLFKRDDTHAEKLALEKKQEKLTRTLEEVQHEMEQLQQSIRRRRSSVL